ncbi:MAG: carboxypeptidase regulatory-like domain-containing protein [Gemmatimonadaceae bacterium]
MILSISRPRHLTTVGALLLCAASLDAQQATIKGRVVDRTTQVGLARVEVVFLGDHRSVTTDSTGQYLFVALPAGTAQFLVRAPFFPATQVIVEVMAGENPERIIVLDSTAAGRNTAQALPATLVEAAPLDRRLEDFERRRRTGRGHYLTRAEIERSGASSLQDAVRTLRGVAVECGGGQGCYVRMVRAPMQCKPDYVIDRRIDNNFGPTTPIRDIEAVEVYTGPSDVPGEFAGRSAGCGVVVIWTGAGPATRR